jgi:hypothetical protein
VEIIAFSGKIGSGKDYIANNVFLPMLPKKNTLFVSFADHFKAEAVAKYGMSAPQVFGFETRTDEVRRYLQLTGTEEGRNKFGENIWVSTLFAWMYIHEKRGVERFIVTDCRFANEASLLEKRGATVIRVIAPRRTSDKVFEEAKGDLRKISIIMNHESETSLDSYHFTNIVRNDYEEDFLSDCKRIASNLQ